MREAGTGTCGCILARNEARRIAAALESLQGWTDQIVVIDNESDDETVAVAQRYTGEILTAPRALNFDAARNLAIDRARGDWIFYLDADERVPPRLGAELARLVREEGDRFEALLIPFKHHFCGKWMEHSGWWPGYTRPQLLKKGCFRYNARLHAGVEVEGRTLLFPAEDPDLAIVHHSYDDLSHYLTKLNRYTDAEAESLLADGAPHTWQAQLAHFVQDWQQYYERGRADRDGMHGFVLAFMSAFYRFAARAKLWDRRRQQGGLTGGDPVPADLREMLEFMAHVTQHGAGEWLGADQRPRTNDQRPTTEERGAVGRERFAASRELPLIWRAPLLDPSGYADEARHLVQALIEAGEPVAVVPERWGGDARLPEATRQALLARAVPPDTASELHVCHTLPALLQPSPHAGFNIARTMFETDRLPPGAVPALNAMDRIWVPTEFNRETFARAGVAREKIAVIPGAIDPAPFAADAEPWPLPGDNHREPRAASREPVYTFLSVFDWTLHKGWDVLLTAFAAEFGTDPEVRLVLKVWSSNGYSPIDLRDQADALLRARFGRPLGQFPNLRLWCETLPAAELPRVYRAADAFVLPTRGEGWCRPLMEAMASGLPTIATAWSGVTAFHDAGVGFPLPCEVVPVPEAAAREVPLYAGHCWAEPDPDELRRLMRRLVEHPEEGQRRGKAAQEAIGRAFSRPAVAALLTMELARCRELARRRLASDGRRPTTNDRREVAGAPSLPPVHTVAVLPKADPVPIDPVSPVAFAKRLGRRLRLRWEGDQAVFSSLARVNRAFCAGLLGDGDVELSLAEGFTPWHSLTAEEDPQFATLLSRRNAALSGPPDVVVRQYFPPNWEPPRDASRLVMIQPWRHGHLPVDWVRGARENATEVWVHSRFVRDLYVRSGVPAEKVRIVPLGFDPSLYTAEGPARALPTGKSIRFLFVGGALHRKGADILLQAYLRAFTRADDVCLVIKDMGTRTFYQGQTYADAARRIQLDPRAPELLYWDEDLTDAQLAAIYRSCTCLVLPYRAEGFALPPLEAAACGLPAIVTSGGPTDDYLDDQMAIRLPHRRKPSGSMNVGPFQCVGDPWALEPDLDALVDTLRWIRDHAEEARRMGRVAQEHAHAGWTWQRAVAVARERLCAVAAPQGGAATAPARLWSEPVVAPPALPFVEDGPALSGRPLSLPGRGATHETRIKTATARPEVRALTRHRDRGVAVIGGRSAAVGAERPELSLCMIARDEEARIAHCLQSIAPWVDELIVVDTGSTDHTREIARACGARVFDFAWSDSFAEARNQSLDQARGQWLFWMDADDVISPECGRKLRELIRRHPQRDVAYQVQVRIPPGPGEFSESVVDHVKLFPNRPDVRFEHRIHEQILAAIRRAGLRVEFSDLHVTHANYDRSPEGQEKKRRRDFRLLELDLQDQPDHPFVLFNLGMTHLYTTREYEVAAHYLRRSLDRSHPTDSIVRKAYAMLVTARLCQGERDAAIAANEEGRQQYPEDAEMLFQAGQIYQQNGRWEEARAALERLIGGTEEAHYRSVDLGLRAFRGQHELALLLQRTGDAAGAERRLREISEAHPAYLPARVDRVETLLELGRRDEALALLRAIPAAPGVREELTRLRAMAGVEESHVSDA